MCYSVNFATLQYCKFVILYIFCNFFNFVILKFCNFANVLNVGNMSDIVV